MTTEEPTISAECQEWLDRQSGEFMEPQSDLIDENDAMENEDGETMLSGWYARLSAPGYLDCTEWIGPFDTEVEAMESLYEMFGD